MAAPDLPSSEPAEWTREKTGTAEVSGLAGGAGSVLVTTAAVAVAAKIVSAVVLPGLRGVAQQSTIELFEVLSSSAGYTLAALLVALTCAGSFELAHVRHVGPFPRAIVVGGAGLVVALASPAVVQRLHPFAAMFLAFSTSAVTLLGAIVALQRAQTRAVAGMLGLLALSATLRGAAWEAASVAADHGSLRLYQVARSMTTAATALHVFVLLIASAWVVTRPGWRGRILANLSLVVATALTYVAARDTGSSPSRLEAVLHNALAGAGGVPAPYGLSSVAAFLVPASLLVGGAALVQRGQRPMVVASLVLALISHGFYDVPLQALSAITAVQWILLAMGDPSRAPQRSRVQQPTSIES